MYPNYYNPYNMQWAPPTKFRSNDLKFAEGKINTRTPAPQSLISIPASTSTSTPASTTTTTEAATTTTEATTTTTTSSPKPPTEFPDNYDSLTQSNQKLFDTIPSLSSRRSDMPSLSRPTFQQPSRTAEQRFQFVPCMCPVSLDVPLSQYSDLSALTNRVNENVDKNRNLDQFDDMDAHDISATDRNTFE